MTELAANSSAQRGVGTAVDDKPGRRSDQPDQDAEADDVWQSWVRTLAWPGSAPSLIISTQSGTNQNTAGADTLPHRLNQFALACSGSSTLRSCPALRAMPPWQMASNAR